MRDVTRPVITLHVDHERQGLWLKCYAGPIDALPPGLGRWLAEHPDIGLRVIAVRGGENNRLYGLYIPEASEMVPRSVFAQSQFVIKPLVSSGHGSAWILPLFDGAMSTAAEESAVQFDDGYELGIVVNKSRRVIAFLVPDGASGLALNYDS